MLHTPRRAVVQAARRAAREVEAPLLLAVSGGLDSMALLHAMAAVARARIAGVATFDHGTGPAATSAADHVARTAEALGLPVVRGRAVRPGAREDAWRRDRFEFLRSAAAPLGARIVTAHTEDDQVETVLMRLMRGSGARGLAGLRAGGDVVRPFLELRREVLERYASATGIRWYEDPTNLSRAFLRNRLRHDLLPALRRVDPSIDGALLEVGRNAAEWRRNVEAYVDSRLRPERSGISTLRVARKELRGHDADSLAMLWTALAGRLGIALDRRGTHRLTSFTMTERLGGLVPLSGGWCVEASPGAFVIRRGSGERRPSVRLPQSGVMTWGSFNFRVAEALGRSRTERTNGVWSAALPIAARFEVRGWSPGDRLSPSEGQRRRRVKRYLSEAGVRGMDRAEWPVVAAGDDVVWIPGVRRSDAATERSGRPVRHYVCERIVR